MVKEAHKHDRRLRRQLAAMSRVAPQVESLVDRLLDRRARMIRILAAGFLMFGGVFAILPVLGLWMLPLGLMLLAVDIPALRPRVSATIIRGRRRLALWRRRWWQSR